MAVVFLPVVKPLAVDGNPLVNGKLGPCDLVPVWFPGAGHLSLNPHTARAFKMLMLLCRYDENGPKLWLSATGAYRSYEQQVNVFVQRYSLTYDPHWNVDYSTRTWDGKKYYLKRASYDGGAYAPVAVPGTSNHGLGIAVDCGWWKGVNEPGLADIAGVQARGYEAGWKYLVDNAESLGFSWEGAQPGQKGWEPWHLRHVLGNTVSQRVLDLEAFLGIAA